MKDIKESLNAASGPKTLFGGLDSAEKSRIWYNDAEFVLFKGTTRLQKNCRTVLHD